MDSVEERIKNLPIPLNTEFLFSIINSIQQGSFGIRNVENFMTLAKNANPDTTLQEIEKVVGGEIHFMSALMKISAMTFWNVTNTPFTKLIEGNEIKGIPGISMQTTLGEISRQLDNDEWLIPNIMRAYLSLTIMYKQSIIGKKLNGRCDINKNPNFKEELK